MRTAIVRFPGSNCDQDCFQALAALGYDPHYLWHKENSVSGFDFIVLPGGFSYGDYLRCGAIARFSPVMKSVIEFAKSGGLVMGICNGFQILCESGLLPGALMRNRSLHFVCKHVGVRVEHYTTAWTQNASTGMVLNIPIAHGEGRYVADAETVEQLRRERRILLKYCDADGATSDAGNPNGSVENIAGICNAAGNVFGLMPHPERACDPLLGSIDGRVIFESLLASRKVQKVA